MNCISYILICVNQSSTDCKKKYFWGLSIKANIGDDEINFNGKDFLIKLLNKCKSFLGLFKES